MRFQLSVTCITLLAIPGPLAGQLSATAARPASDRAVTASAGRAPAGQSVASAGHAAALRDRMVARISQVPGADVAVSYHDLATGDSVLINASVPFHAASTMKVPVMIEVLRAVEAGRLSLDQGILLVNSFPSIADGTDFSVDARDDSDSSMYARVGQRVPVRELLERMVVRSSNLATNALIALVGAKQVSATAAALGAPDAHVLRGVEDGKAFAAGMNNTITAEALATLLRKIETGEALSASSALEMRGILLRQELNDEIPAGLPAGTRVAHKTGSITGHLHDAAIVYPAGRAPYVLVVLTRGIPDEKVARGLIVDLSRMTWEASTR